MLFCGFNGVVLDHFIEVSWRLGYDLICLSGPRDQDALEQLVEPASQQRTVLTGLRRNAPSTIHSLKGAHDASCLPSR